MRTRALGIPVAVAVTAAALALAVGVLAQSPATSAPTPRAPAVGGRHEGASAVDQQQAGMKAECGAMVALGQESQAKVEAMDATLDRLVAEMNTAGAEDRAGAMERPMAAVINELVAQRKAMRSMSQHMQEEMVAHLMRHIEMSGSAEGKRLMSECPVIPRMKQAGSAEHEHPGRS